VLINRAIPVKNITKIRAKRRFFLKAIRLFIEMLLFGNIFLIGVFLTGARMSILCKLANIDLLFYPSKERLI